jgi:uncharacterized protein (TIGR02147 family)
MNMKKISIYTYLDYRVFLRDAYARLHARNRAFNYVAVCKKVDLKSPSHITAILKGTRNIPERLIDPFARAFSLNKKESRYFYWLVCYNQAKTHSKKDEAFQKLLSFHSSDSTIINPQIYTYFSHWYHPVIRELVALIAVTRDDYHRVAHALQPRITPAAAQRALSLLERLGIISITTQGVYTRTDKVLTTGEGWRSIIINNYQRAAMDLARKAVERFAAHERDISTLTLSISEETFSRMREKIASLRKELLDMARADTNAQRIYQCNFQLFPVSCKKDDPHDET